MSDIYRDIMYIPHPVSIKHPPMPAIKRAAQFAPFSALTGLRASIAETGRLTSQKAVLREDMQREIDRKLMYIKSCLPSAVPVTFVYFEPDKSKDGGAYITITSPVRSIDEIYKTIRLQNGEIIQIKNIRDIKI